LQHNALTRLEPLQQSTPQLPNLGLRANDDFVAKDMYSRVISVFGGHFAACSSASSSANVRSQTVGEATSMLQIETESEDKIAASTSVPSSESLSKLEACRNEDANLLQANGATIQDSNSTKREEQERIAKQHAVSEMHRLFAEEVSRGGTPTGNAVKALRRLAEAG
jgi:hypothetical protein